MGQTRRHCWLTATSSQAEENPGFLDTLLTILENEQNPGIRLSGTHSKPPLEEDLVGAVWGGILDGKLALKHEIC